MNFSKEISDSFIEAISEQKDQYEKYGWALLNVDHRGVKIYGKGNRRLTVAGEKTKKWMAKDENNNGS
jgi:hypothetical protein